MKRAKFETTHRGQEIERKIFHAKTMFFPKIKFVRQQLNNITIFRLNFGHRFLNQQVATSNQSGSLQSAAYKPAPNFLNQDS